MGAKDRASLLTKYKMMSTDLENLREKLENEAMRKSDALKALSKSQAEIQLWKSRFETEGMGRIEELEGARNKLQAKIVENEELVDVLSTKVATAEKSKGRLGSDLDEISMEYERVHAAALITEKRAKNFDKVLGEWQSKAADLQAEINASQDEGRNYSSELFCLKAAQQSPLSSWMLSSVRTRTWLMRSRTSLTSLVRVDAPSMLLTNSAVCLSRRRRSSRVLLRRLRPLLRWRRTEFSAPSLSLPMSDRRLTDVLLRRRRSSTIPERTMPVPWSLLELPLRLSREPRVRVSASRSSLRERSMNLRLVWTTPTRPTLRD